MPKVMRAVGDRDRKSRAATPLVAEPAAGEVRGAGEGDEHVAGMGDAGIGQQAFEVVLQQREDVADRHGQGRQEPEQGRHLLAEADADQLVARACSRRPGR